MYSYTYTYRDYPGDSNRTTGQIGSMTYAQAGAGLSFSYTYDGSGNPLTYYNGSHWSFSWADGGKLMSAVASDGTTITYTYDVDGTRSVKRVGDVSHTYIWEDGRPLQECVSGNTGIHSAGTIMYFHYDMNGRPYALQYNGTIFYYLLNAQGDVIRMIDSTGATVASYEYDPFGNIVSATGTMAEANPLRYRGYYYDRETGFYYLNSRYYDPKLGRFINADSYVSTGQGIMGYNMFAYCGNNPVNRVDPTGQLWSEIWGFAKTAVTEIGKTMELMSPAYAGCGGATLSDGPLPFGDIVGLAGATLLTVGAIGYGVYQAAQAPSISIPKAETKEKDITVPPPSPTVIYRYGGTNPGNLTPSQRDVDLYPITRKGLSFSTVPKPGAAMTTIEALNATGVVYAVYDGAGHVSVHPLGGTLEDWHNAGSSSVWTTAVKSVVVKWNGGN
ncbi:MAG: RHS repeat-associated core domain-containing protein [Lachnospiraceae bacterium]|nr:RHS repeat-associated core domain-containing protein [Lachnospiraceae bacterium]